ncbi:MAG: hypothetical protein O7C59_09930, partial [Rickettsia endosymbiont of Ixodes persulcatus]|nr:hypothetical protein [Rickettsia endosymbiont of Ixodes persulcatus]
RHLIRIIVSDSKLKAIKLAMIIIPRKGFEEINCSHLNYELSKIILKKYFKYYIAHKHCCMASMSFPRRRE